MLHDKPTPVFIAGEQGVASEILKRGLSLTSRKSCGFVKEIDLRKAWRPIIGGPAKAM
jgi:hypothetical protein